MPADKKPVDEQVRVLADLLHSILNANDLDVAMQEKKLAVSVQFDEMEKVKKPYSPAEVRLLLSCFPQERDVMTELSERLLNLLVPRVRNLRPVLARALSEGSSDHVLKLVEMLAAKNSKVHVPTDFEQWYLHGGRWTHAGATPTLDDLEAKLVLLSLALFDAEGNLVAQPYSKVVRALMSAPRYASVRDLKFTGFEFTKFMVLQRFADEAAGSASLIVQRQPVYTQFPLSVRTSPQASKTVVTNMAEHATKGYKLRHFIETLGRHPEELIPAKKHPFVRDLPAAFVGEHVLLPEYSQVVFRSTLPPAKPTRPNWNSHYHVDSHSVMVAVFEEQHDAFHPHVVKVVVNQTPPASAVTLTEATIPTPDLQLVLCTPMTTLLPSREVIPVEGMMTNVKVSVDNPACVSVIWLEHSPRL